MIKVSRRRGITLHFLNIIDSCEVKVKDSDYILMLAILLIILLLVNITDCLQPSGCNGPKNNKANCSLFFDTQNTLPS